MNKKIEAIIRTFRFDAIREAFYEVELQVIAVVDAKGSGRQKGHTKPCRGAEYIIDLLPGVKIEIVLPDNQSQEDMEAIRNATWTGDEKISSPE